MFSDTEEDVLNLEYLDITTSDINSKLLKFIKTCKHTITDVEFTNLKKYKLIN